TLNTILIWIKDFRTEAATRKKRPPRGVRIIRIPENIQARHAVQNTSIRSTEKHTVALVISDRSVREILHLDIKFSTIKLFLFKN
ncbi:hypothetical protein C0J52_23462, partial [Blattella germanica]